MKRLDLTVNESELKMQHRSGGNLTGREKFILRMTTIVGAVWLGAIYLAGFWAIPWGAGLVASYFVFDALKKL